MIQYLDVLSILLLNLRSIFSFWSLYDDKRVEIYSRVRLVTFWIQWPFLFAIILAFVLYTVISNEEGDNQWFLLSSLATISFLLVFVLVDYHFCKVIQYFAQDAPKRRHREGKELRKAERAEERERRKTLKIQTRESVIK